MNTPEIEYLIAEAINKRPKVTNAPLNLYVYDNEVICGARIVMPQDAVFISYVRPDQLQNGFTDREWKLIVEKTKEIIGTEELAANATKKLKNVKQNELQRRIKDNQSKFKEQRTEQRLSYRRPIQFSRDFKKTFSQAHMVDVSSGGMAFICQDGNNCPYPGQRITTHFSIPRYNSDGSFDSLTFTRIGRICRVDQVNDFLRRVAVQFAEPLPFKPAEQSNAKAVSYQQKTLNSITT